MFEARRTFFAILLSSIACGASLVACGDDEGEVTIQTCTPEGSCECVDGAERELACSCLGGSSCAIEGDSIEFSCDGNAACGLTCGTNCLITCPGTTSCTVDSGDDAVISCPGTATCDITCQGDCTVSISGTAKGVVRCEDPNATCTVEGCTGPALIDCGDGVSACRTSCPDADAGI